MKTLYLYLFFFVYTLNCSSQNFQLKLTGVSEYENKVLDSLNYLKNHKNIKSINDEIAATTDKLLKIGYIENQLIENKKGNDSIYIAKFSLGERLNSIHIYIGKNTFSTPKTSRFSKVEEKKTKRDFNNTTIRNLIGLDEKKDTLVLPFTEVETFLNKSMQKLEQQGFAFARLKLDNIKKNNKIIYSELKFELNNPRELNSIIVKYTDNNKKNSFPKGHLAQINRKYRNSTFNKNVVHNIYEDFEKFRFVSQVKYPEILFTKDSTKTYVYLDKRKSNVFDGIIGFSNTKNNKIRFNGYLDLTLENTLKAGEQFSLYWKSDGNNQKTFTTGIQIPYLFKSPFGLKASINIFKQDSVFQNTKTGIDLGYYIDYNTRIYLGYQATESSDIQNSNNKTLSDYKNSYITSNFDFLKFDTNNSNFPIKSKLSISLGIGERTTNELAFSPGVVKQKYINIQAMHNFYLNPKNGININYHNYLLKSDTYIINELFRFGGINSIRGFSENNFQANFMTSIQSEYRYILSSSLYLHSILDYCYFKDNSLNNKGNLVGIGLGLGLNTKTGLLKFAFANSINKNQAVKSFNTIIHISYNVEF